MTSENKDNTISLAVVKNAKGLNNPTDAELLTSGLKLLEDEIASDNIKGFLTIAFDLNNEPRIVWAGEIEMLSVLGSIEVAKVTLMSGLTQGD